MPKTAVSSLKPAIFHGETPGFPEKNRPRSQLAAPEDAALGQAATERWGYPV